MIKTIYEDLTTQIKATPFASELTTDENETEQNHLRKIITFIGNPEKFSDASWNNLNAASQEWYNNATAAVNAMNSIAPCPGYESKVKEPVAVPVAVSNPVPVASKKKGMMHRLRELALLNPKVSYQELNVMANAEGFTCTENTAWTCYQEVKNVLRAIETSGQRVVTFGAV